MKMTIVKGMDLKIGDVVLIPGNHYVKVQSAATDPNGLMLIGIPRVTTPTIPFIQGNPLQDYQLVDAEDFATLLGGKDAPVAAAAATSGQTNSENMRPVTASKSALDALLKKPTA